MRDDIVIGSDSQPPELPSYWIQIGGTRLEETFADLDTAREAAIKWLQGTKAESIKP
jgi:hypothetical protein